MGAASNSSKQMLRRMPPVKGQCHEIIDPFVFSKTLPPTKFFDFAKIFAKDIFLVIQRLTPRKSCNFTYIFYFET